MSIIIDPITLKEFHDAVSSEFNDLIEELDTEALEEMDYQDIAEIFFLNGFFRGARAMTDNIDLKETLYMMTKEIEYQMKEK